MAKATVAVDIRGMDEVRQIVAEVERLRSWIDRQEPLAVYEATICPICHQPTEARFWLPVEPHAPGCPWREATRSSQDDAG